jgi:hypothetical protein
MVGDLSNANAAPCRQRPAARTPFGAQELHLLDVVCAVATAKNYYAPTNGEK